MNPSGLKSSDDIKHVTVVVVSMPVVRNETLTSWFSIELVKHLLRKRENIGI